MKGTFIIIIAIGILFILIIFYAFIRGRRKRNDLYDFFKTRINRIQTASEQFSSFLSFENGYFSNHQLQTWNYEYVSLYSEINGKPFENIKLTTSDVDYIKSFINYNENSLSLRNEYNKQFITYELKSYNTFFNKIEKHGLDTQQQVAIISDEDNSIVIAGAGSGKTTTIVGKVNYIIDRYKINPEEILLISFTNKSATTLAQRVNIEGVEAKTFHKFGKDVICEVEGKQPSIFDESQFKSLVTKYFKELLKNQDYLHKVTTYFTNFLKLEKPQDDFENQGEYIQYLKDKDFKTYKTKEFNRDGITTYKREIVKSIEECKIANFLLFNSVIYEYELPYKHETATMDFRQYKPDFTINPKDNSIYIEHFGINKNGLVPHFFADKEKGETIQQATKKYLDGISWKRELHNTNNTLLIETYSYEMFDGVLFDNLTKKLTEFGIQLKPKNEDEVWKIICDSAKNEVDNFITLFQTFITLMKSNNYSIADIVSKNKTIKNEFQQQRNSIFIEIVKPIYDMYESYLKERKEVDFSDLINRASHYITNKHFDKKYRYIIIDEFQDISLSRYQLVKAIKDSNPSCKLFCVGDDWQSIYRFTGSDITLFKNFENFFGYTVKSKIETTYRFHNPLIKLSSDFILKNPNQEKKELKSNSASKTTNHKIIYSNSDNQDDTIALQEIFDELMLQDDYSEKEIYVLGRYSFDINRIKNQSSLFMININKGSISYSKRNKDGELKTINASFMTVHKSKGLEAEIIVLLNCNSGKNGFPSEISDDPVLNLLLSESDQYENGEERRLFYVAMTRAKEFLYFISDNSYKSKFITELEVETQNSPNKKCPLCKTADVILKKEGKAKNGNAYKFYGCINYLYGCNYATIEWINFA